MNTKNLSFYFLLALSLGGCAQNMAKEDGSSPPAATSHQQDDNSQAKASETEGANDQNAAHASTASSGDGAAQQAKTATSPPTATNMAKNPAPEEEAAAASKFLPLPPKEIISAINKLTTLPRVRYLSRTAQYDYYVGGRVDAKYDINKNQLVVTNAPAVGENMVTCQYSKDGNMISDKKAIPSDKVEECNKLINELTTYLAL